MPIYEYACGKCGHEFEAEQRMSDAPLKTCPRCRSRKVKRLISQTSFVLKGGGWYSDLYASPGKTAKTAKPEAGGATREAEGPGKASEPGGGGDAGKSKSGESGTGGDAAKGKSGKKGSPKAAA
jgi:putative FmdB family regulatory protein